MRSSPENGHVVRGSPASGERIPHERTGSARRFVRPSRARMGFHRRHRRHARPRHGRSLVRRTTARSSSSITRPTRLIDAEAYTPQLALYGLAIERAFGKRPAHAWLHFLRSDTLVEVPLDYHVAGSSRRTSHRSGHAAIRPQRRRSLPCLPVLSQPLSRGPSCYRLTKPSSRANAFSIRCGFFSTPANKSPTRANRSGAFPILNCDG